MNDPEKIYNFLKWTGHLQYPDGQEQNLITGPFNQAIKSAEGKKAVASFQKFEADLVNRLCMKIHGRPAQFDGDIGPATEKAFDVERCGHPDYGPEVQAAVGSGSWKRCHGVGEFHAAKVFVNTDQIPSFLKPYWDEVMKRCISAYMDIGLKWILTENENEANTTISFVQRSTGYIGLAIVGQQETCSSQIWARFLATYKPSNVLNEWVTLVRHELGHNAGLQHSSGGCMNPSIVSGLAPTWRGDPSESILVRYYGGVPVEKPPLPPEVNRYWKYIGYKDNMGDMTWVELPVPIPITK